MKRMTEGLLAVLILAAADPVWACRWNTQPGAGSHMSLGATYAPRASWGATRADVDTTDTWTLPTSVWSMCDYNSECQPSLTADGKTLYYAVGRVNGPTPDGLFYGNETQMWNVYVARWNEAESRWDSVANVGPVVNPAREPSVTPEGDTLYVAKDNDIYVAYRNAMTGDWDVIELVGAPVSLGGSSESFPHVTRDGTRLFFASDREPGEPWGGDLDIYVAYRNPATGAWGSVEMLGPGVNTSDTEGSPSLSADGTRLRFTDFPGYRYGPKYGEFDLYVSQWDSAIGDWGTAKLVPSPLNCDRCVCSCFETLDGKLYLGSEIWEGVKGEEDLMVCTRPAGAAPGSGGPPADGGPATEWQKVGELGGARNVYAMVEGSRGALYAGALAEPLDEPRGVVYRSTDNGQTWIPTTPLTEAMAVLSLLAVGDTLYAGTYPNGDVFRSIDGGTSWTATGELFGVTGVRALARTSDGTIIAGTSPDSSKTYRFFRSTNAGASWNRLGDAPRATGGIEVVFEMSEGVLFAGGRHYSHAGEVIFYLSTDGGATWDLQHLPVTHERLTIGHIYFFRQTSDGTVWAGGWAHGPQGILCRSTDEGLTWEWMPTLYRGRSDSLVTVARIFDFVEAPDGSYIVATQPAPDSLCWRSTDAGETWRTMGPLVGAWEALCLLRTSGGEVLAGTTPNGDVYKWTPTAADEIPARYGLSLHLSGWTRDVRSITYALPQPGNVRLRIHNAAGRAVATPADGFVPAGVHTVRWQVRGPGGELLPNGVYFITLQTNWGSRSARTVVAR